MEKRNAGRTGINRLVRATYCSMLGLQAAWKNEQAFRQELLLCTVLVPLAILLGKSGVERGLLVASLLLVLVAELLNSAVEAVVDRVGEEHHELSGRAKDLGSAAVGLALVNVVVIWLLVLL